MNRLQKTFLALFVCFLLAVPAWRFWVVPELLQMPGDFERTFDILGTEKPNYEIGGDSAETIIYKGIKRTHWAQSSGNEVSAELFFEAETVSGDPLYEISKKHKVDRDTRKVIASGKEAFYLIPPTHLQKKSYVIQDPTLLIDVVFHYEKEERVNGLAVYYFKSNTRGLDSTDGYSFLDLVPETYSAVDDVVSELWIEPIAGIMVNFQQTGASFYLDSATDERIHNFTNYTNSFSEDTIVNQVRLAQNAKQKIQLYELWVPVLLSLLSFAFLIALFASRNMAFSQHES
jgi:hypothetical protein